jgi:GTP-sensing pleiotropic transcriptional regulator CodY
MDTTGEPLLLVDQDAIVKLTIDFIDWLETSETISSVSATARNCTISVSTTSPRTVITISDVTNHHDGDITIIATSSTGEKFRQIIRVRRTNRYTDEALLLSDYV